MSSSSPTTNGEMNNNNDNNDSSGGILDAQRAKAAFIFIEDIAPGLRIEADLKNILCRTQSQYQKIDVIETYFGKTLVTDGKTQSSEFDEVIYHESLVHPSMIKFNMLSSGQGGGGPKSVFIGGGGELATAREVLRHKSLDRVVMVDLDKEVTDVCTKYLPEWGGEAVRNHPKLELIFGDAYEYLLNTEEKFDVIIMDISDPIEAGPGIMLYTKEFYEHARKLLNPGGVFVTQAGMADAVPPPHSDGSNKDTTCFGPIHNTLIAAGYDVVIPYTTNLPSFGSDWGFVMACNTTPNEEKDAESIKESFCKLSSSTAVDNGSSGTYIIESIIEKQIDGGELTNYDSETHLSMFSLTKLLRKSISNDNRVMTRDNPIFMY